MPDLTLNPAMLRDAYQSGMEELAAAWREHATLQGVADEKLREVYTIETRVKAIGRRLDSTPEDENA